MSLADLLIADIKQQKNSIYFTESESKDEELRKLYEKIAGIFPYENTDDFILAWDKEKLVGFTMLTDKGEWTEEVDDITTHMYELHDFGVHPDHRRQGIGTAMLKYTYDKMELFEGSARMELDFSDDNLEFYKKATKGMNATFQNLDEGDVDNYCINWFTGPWLCFIEKK